MPAMALPLKYYWYVQTLLVSAMRRDVMLLEATWAAAWSCFASSTSAAAAAGNSRSLRKQQEQRHGLWLVPPPLLLLRWLLFKLLLLDSLAAVRGACSIWSNMAACGLEVASQTPCSWPLRWEQETCRNIVNLLRSVNFNVLPGNSGKLRRLLFYLKVV
jgi:hypothetical protein